MNEEAKQITEYNEYYINKRKEFEEKLKRGDLPAMTLIGEYEKRTGKKFIDISEYESKIDLSNIVYIYGARLDWNGKLTCNRMVINDKDVTKPKKENKEPEKKIVLVSRFSPKLFAEDILQNNLFIKDKYKRFWRYVENEGIWREDAEEWLRRYVRDFILEENINASYYVNEIVSYIKDISYEPDEEMKQDPDLIPLKNCVYRISDGSFLPFKPEMKITNKLHINYNPNATGIEVIDKFFSDVVGENKKNILYDLCAYSLYRGYPYQKMFFLYGSGANGKSTFLLFLERFLGKDNVSSESIDSLTTNKFALSSIFGKLVNISSDINYDIIANSNILKMLTGGDSLMCERKYMPSFPFFNYAKLIFSANQLPRTVDNTSAFFRRLYLIEFPYEFKKENRDAFILTRLCEEEVLEFFLLVSLNRLREMKSRGWVFENEEPEEVIKNKYLRLSNPIMEFIEENCEIDVSGWVGEQTFYNKYSEWAKEKKRNILNPKEIKKLLNEMGIQKERKYSEGNRYPAFIGIRWRDVDKDVTNVNFEEDRNRLIAILKIVGEITKEQIEGQQIPFSVVERLKKEGIIYERRPGILALVKEERVEDLSDFNDDL